MQYVQITLLLLLGLPVSVGAQPVTQVQRVLANEDMEVPLSVPAHPAPVDIIQSRFAPADTVARWSGRGQVGVHWTEGVRDVVLLMAEHDLLFQAPPFEAYASILGSASWTDIFTSTDATDATRTQRVYRYALDLHGQRALSSRVHAITTVVWLSDPSQGIERQLYAGAGAMLMLNQKQSSYSLQTQATGGYLQEREVSGEHLDTPAAAVALNLAFRFAAGGHLSFRAEAIDNLSEPEDLLMRLRGSLTAPLGERFGLTVSVDLSHDFLPAATYVEEDETGALVSITPAAFSAFIATGLSIRW